MEEKETNKPLSEEEKQAVIDMVNQKKEELLKWIDEYAAKNIKNDK